MMFKVAFATATIITILTSTAPGCFIVCNPPSTHVKDKPIEQLQAHPFPARKNAKASK